MPKGEFHAKKTHCPHGHMYSPENTLVYRGSRFCLECKRTRARIWAKEHRATIKASGGTNAVR